MIGKNIAGRLAITSKRRGLATAVVYGLSLAVRFTSATGWSWKSRRNPHNAHTR